MRLVAGQAEVNSLGYLRHLERKYLFILRFLILTSTQDLEMTDQRTNDRLLERTRTLGLTSSASACMQLEQTYLQLHLATPAHS